MSMSNNNSSHRSGLRPNFLVNASSGGSRSGGSSSYNRGGASRRVPPLRSIPPYIWLSIGGTSILVTWTYYEFLEEVPLTHRKRWIATSPKWEKQLGDDEYRKLLQSYRNNILPPNHRASQTVQRVGSRIATASHEFAKQYHVPMTASTSPPYTYTVVRSEQANAFVLPGNHVFVLTGLFQYVHNEDELAAVLGHEVAHNLARHAGEKISGSIVVNVLARLSLLLDPTGLLIVLLLPAATLFRELPHSRIQESEADEIGVHLAALACYDPRAAPRVFANMKEGHPKPAKNGTTSRTAEEPPEFLSTHPSHESRIANFDKWMPTAMAIYQSDHGHRCQKLRHDMELARQLAAKQAAARERGGGGITTAMRSPSNRPWSDW